MNRRSLLARAAGIVGVAYLAGCLGSAESARPLPQYFMGFTATHPDDRPLVAGGLTAESDADRYGRLLTARPEVPVFTDRIEAESPYMRSQVQKDRYDSRFLVVAELRRDAPFVLTSAVPHRVRWDDTSELRVGMEASPYDDVPDDLRGVRPVVSTALLIFEHDGTRPETVTMPVTGPDGGSLGTIVAASESSGSPESRAGSNASYGGSLGSVDVR